MRRERNYRRPTWGLFYAIGLLMIVLLMLIEMFVPAGGLHGMLQIAVVLASFGFMAFWRRHNRVAIELEEWSRRARR